jgi:hypothetical protein
MKLQSYIAGALSAACLVLAGAQAEAKPLFLYAPGTASDILDVPPGQEASLAGSDNSLPKGFFVDKGVFVVAPNSALTDYTVTVGIGKISDVTAQILGVPGTMFAPSDPFSSGMSPQFLLGPGTYTLEVSGMALSKAGYSVGLFGIAVPEPATWSLMIFGFGLLGAGLRMRSKELAGVAV